MLPFLGSAPVKGDLRNFFWPAWTFTRQAIWSGHFPLWNPYLGCGESWCSNFQAGLYYPPNLLLYLAPFGSVLTLYYIGMVALSGSSALFFLESAGFEGLPALGGALAWQWGGFFMIYQDILAYCGALSWVIALSGCVLQVQKTSSRRFHWIAAGAVCFACLWLVGSPHFAFLGTLMQVVFVDWRRPWKTFCIPFLGTLLSAVLLIPVAAELTHSTRFAISRAFNLSFNLTWDHFPALFCAEIYRFTRGAPPDVDFESYFGFIPTLLVVFALAQKASWRLATTRQAFFLIMMGIAMALGDLTPVYPLMLHCIPGLALFRAPARFIMWASVGVCLLTAEGLRRCPKASHVPLLVLLLLDLVGLSWPYLDSGQYQVPPALSALAADKQPYRIQLSDGDFGLVNVGEIIGHGHVTLYDPMAPRSYVEYLLYNELQAIPNPSWYDRASHNSNALFLQNLATPSFRLLNVGLSEAGGRLAPCRESLPHFFLVGKARVIQNYDDTLLALSGLDPLKEVLLDRQPPPTQTPQHSDLKLLDYYCNGFSLRVQTDKAAMLVASEFCDDGWRARIDGQETPIYRADAIFRAVQVAPGEHLVEMEYSPASFRWGLGVSLGTMLLCATGAAWEIRQRAERPL